MSEVVHKIYIFILFGIVIAVIVLLSVFGIDFYLTDVEQRFFHEQNDLLKPGGTLGHGIGIVGFFLLIIGVFGYILKKRVRKVSPLSAGPKYGLEFYLFLSFLGAVFVLFHSAFRFGGLASYGFWSMVLVLLSSVIGWFLYLQIPRTPSGKEMTEEELQLKKQKINSILQSKFLLDEDFIVFINHALSAEIGFYENSGFFNFYKRFSYEHELVNSIESELNARNVSKKELKTIVKYIHAEIVLNRKNAWLPTMRRYLKYWNVVHLTLAIIMLLLITLHVVVAILFGYKWIF